MDYSKLVKEVKSENLTSKDTPIKSTTSSVPDYNKLVQEAKESVTRETQGGSDVFTPGLKVSDYTPYTGDLIRGADYDEQRAQGQGRLAKLGAGLVNTASSLVFEGLKDASYLLDFEQMGNLANGTEQEFGNWFGDLMEKGQEAVHQDIYRTKDSLGFHPESAGWWGDAMPSIASGLSMILPALGATKLISGAGKLTKMSKVLRGLGISEEASMGVTGAVVSRYMENTMEGKQTFDSTYQQAIDKGLSEEEAISVAGEAARKNWVANSAMLLQDIPQYMSFFKGFKGMSAMLGESNKALGTTAKILGTGVSEGLEEGYQFISDKESTRSALLNNNVIGADKTFGERMGDYLQDPEFWNSTFLGAIGGGLFESVSQFKEGKRQRTFDSTLAMHKAILTGDKPAYYRAQDNQFNETTLDHFKHNTISSFKDQLEFLKSNPERIEDPQERSEVMQRLNDKIKDLEFVEDLQRKLTIDNTKSTEFKGLEIGASLSQRLAEKRLRDINLDINKNTTEVNQTLSELPVDVLAYKQAKLTLEGMKQVPGMELKAKILESNINDTAKDIVDAYKNLYDSIEALDKSITTTSDETLITLHKNKQFELKNIEATKDYLFQINDPSKKEELEKHIAKLKEEARLAKEAKLKKEKEDAGIPSDIIEGEENTDDTTIPTTTKFAPGSEVQFRGASKSVIVEKFDAENNMVYIKDDPKPHPVTKFYVPQNLASEGPEILNSTDIISPYIGETKSGTGVHAAGTKATVSELLSTMTQDKLEADIERRRQEELNSKNKQLTDYLEATKELSKYGDIVSEAYDKLLGESIKLSKEGKQEESNKLSDLIDYIGRMYAPEDLLQGSKTPISIYLKEAQESLDKWMSSRSEKTISGKINAKYDAELAALLNSNNPLEANTRVRLTKDVSVKGNIKRGLNHLLGVLPSKLKATLAPNKGLDVIYEIQTPEGEWIDSSHGRHSDQYVTVDEKGNTTTFRFTNDNRTQAKTLFKIRENDKIRDLTEVEINELITNQDKLNKLNSIYQHIYATNGDINLSAKELKEKYGVVIYAKKGEFNTILDDASKPNLSEVTKADIDGEFYIYDTLNAKKDSLMKLLGPVSNREKSKQLLSQVANPNKFIEASFSRYVVLVRQPNGEMLLTGADTQLLSQVQLSTILNKALEQKSISEKQKNEFNDQLSDLIHIISPGGTKLELKLDIDKDGKASKLQIVESKEGNKTYYDIPFSNKTTIKSIASNANKAGLKYIHEGSFRRSIPKSLDLDKTPTKDISKMFLSNVGKNVTNSNKLIVDISDSVLPKEPIIPVTKIKKDISDLFKTNPELSKIGNQEEYSKYITTIFPNSKIKDIVYHGGITGIEKFNKDYITYSSKGEKMFFFTDNIQEANEYAKNKENKTKNKNSVYKILLNFENPYFFGTYRESLKLPSELHDNQHTDDHADMDFITSEQQQILQNKNYDSAIGWGFNGGTPNNYLEYVAFEQEQIHILGNKQDIEGFKNFVSNVPVTKTTKKADNDIQAKIDQLEDEVANEENPDIWLYKTEQIEELKTQLLKGKERFSNSDKLDETPETPANKISENKAKHFIDFPEAEESIRKLITPEKVVSFDDINKVIEDIENRGETWGFFAGKAIYLNNKAEKGTEFHEVFHYVFRRLLVIMK
jgi:hypothetical protein